MRHQRLRIYARWDSTSLLAECSTDPAHAKPYLQHSLESAEQEADFLKGTAAVSDMSFLVLDKRTAASQATGWFTAVLPSVVGGRLTFEEQDEGGVYQLRFEGLCDAPKLNADLVSYTVQAKDIREQVRKQRAFTQVTTSTVLPAGVLNGYGLVREAVTGKPAEWMVPPTTPLTGRFSNDAEEILFDGWQSVAGSTFVSPLLLVTDKMRRAIEPVGDAHSNIEVLWRNVGGGAWNTISNIPVRRIPMWTGRSATLRLFSISTADRSTDNRKDVEAVRSVRVTGGTGTFPTPGQSLEVIVRYVGTPTEDYPEHLEGTYGYMLKEALDRHGLSTLYDTTRMNALVAELPRGRIRITAPVDDLREWITRELLRPMGMANTVDEDTFKLWPVSQNLPGTSDVLEEISDSDIVEGGAGAQWQQSSRRANIAVFNIIQETYDPESPDAAGDGVIEEQRQFTYVNPAAQNALLETEIKFDQSTIRVAWGHLTNPAVSDPMAIVLHRKNAVFDRYSLGSQLFEADVGRGKGEAVRVGDWVAVSISWLPDFVTGQRGTNRIAQVVRRKRNEDGSWHLVAEDGGPNSVPVGQPTIGSLSVSADNRVTVNVTAVAAGSEAAVEYAVGLTEPPTKDGKWQTLGRLTAPGSLTTRVLEGGLNVYVRARGEQAGRRPSAWTPTQVASTAAKPGLLEFALEFRPDGTVWAVWRPNAYALGLRLEYDAHDADEDPTYETVEVAAADGEYQFPKAALAGGTMFTVRATPYSGWTGSAVSGTAGPALVETYNRILGPMVEPTIAFTVSQSGLTGTLNLTAADPQLRLLTLEYQTKPPGGSFGAWTAWTGGTGVLGTDEELTRSTTVTLDEKHNASIAFRATYLDSLGAIHTLSDSHTFDGNTDPNITGVAISFSATGQVIVAAVGDEDTDAMYITVGDGAAPSDPTTGVYNAFVSGRTTNGVATGVTVAEGATAFVKVRGRNAYTGSLGSQIASAQLRRPTTSSTPATPRTPLVQVEVSQTGTTGNITLTITDPDLDVTAIQYQKKIGEAGWGAWQSWTGGSGTPGSSTTLQRTQTVTIDEKHNSSIQWLITVNRGAGITEYLGGSHTFDINLVPNILSCAISYDSSGVMSVHPIGDEDVATMYGNVGNGSLPADPTSGSSHFSVSGYRPTAPVSTGQTVTADTVGYVKLRGYNGSDAGPVSTFSLRRPAGGTTGGGGNVVTDATLTGGVTANPGYARPGYNVTVIKETGFTVDIDMEYLDSGETSGVTSVVSGGTASSFSGNWTSSFYYDKPDGTGSVTFTLRVRIKNTSGVVVAMGRSNPYTYNYITLI